MGLSKTDISKLYVSVFGRASEKEGNYYWQQQKEDLKGTANNMLNTEAAKSYFGDTLNDNKSFIEFIYKNTLSKDYFQDPEGIEYWTKLLDLGKSKGDIVSALIYSIDSYRPGGENYDPNDLVTQNAYNQFKNRVELSDHTADNILKAPLDYATSMSFNKNLLVTESKNSLESAKYKIDEIFLGKNLEKSDIDITKESNSFSLYEFKDDYFKNLSNSNMTVTDLEMDITGDIVSQGEHILFSMQGTIEKGIFLHSNKINQKIEGINFPDQIVLNNQEFLYNKFLPIYNYFDLANATGILNTEISIVTPLGVFNGETSVLL